MRDQSNTPSPGAQHGFTLVELMVALVISLLLSIAIYGIFIQSENQQRRTGDTGDMWQQSRIAMAMIERDVRNAGYGMDTGGCSQVLAYDQRLKNGAGAYYTAYPIESVAQTTSSSGSYDPTASTGINTQSLTIRMGSNTAGNAPVTMIDQTPNSTAANFHVSNPSGNNLALSPNDLLLLRLPNSICALTQVTNDPNKSGFVVTHTQGGSNYNTSGGLYDLGQNASPPVTITAEDMNNASVFNLGQGQNTVTYYISDDSTVTGGTTSIPTLMASTLDSTGAQPNKQPVARGIVDLQFQYGYAADSNSSNVSSYGPWDATKVNLIRTVRVALLARTDLPDKNYTSPATYNLLGSTYTVPTSGGAGCVSGNCRAYRHLLLATEIPVRNLIWGN